MHGTFVFADLRELFAKANEEKSGDQLAGIAARSESERGAAKRRLSELSLDEILRQPLIDPDVDDVSRLSLDTHDADNFKTIKSMTVGAFREYILDDKTSEAELKQIQRAIVPEIAAAVAKIMSNKDLILAAAKVRNVTRCRNTMGEHGVLGIRIQPNHPPRRRPWRHSAGDIRRAALQDQALAHFMDLIVNPRLHKLGGPCAR